MKKFLSIILTVVLVASLVVTSLVTSASNTKNVILDWSNFDGYSGTGFNFTKDSPTGYIHVSGNKTLGSSTQIADLLNWWNWTAAGYDKIQFTAYTASGSCDVRMYFDGQETANTTISSTPTVVTYDVPATTKTGDIKFQLDAGSKGATVDVDLYIGDVYGIKAGAVETATTVPTETETTTTAPVGAGITFDDNDMSFVTTVGTACSAEIANGALKVGMNQWDSDLTVKNYARIEIDTTGLTDLKFDAWQSAGTGWDGTDKGSHYGLEIDGVVYWDTPYDSGHINSKSAKTFSVVGVNYYSLVDNSLSGNGTYNVAKRMTADDIQNIDAICIRPGNHYNAQYANIDNITAAKPGEAPVVDPYENIAGTTSVEAQLRIGKVNGIRFITNVNADLIETAESEGYTVTMGTLIAPLTYGELKLDSGAINVVTPGYFFETPGVIAGSIVSIKDKNITRDFIARGYVTLTKDNDSTTYYAQQQTEGRSLKTLAASAVADETFFARLNDAQKEQVTTWATWANA